jgi:hypothetical protein
MTTKTNIKVVDRDANFVTVEWTAGGERKFTLLGPRHKFGGAPAAQVPDKVIVAAIEAGRLGV